MPTEATPGGSTLAALEELRREIDTSAGVASDLDTGGDRPLAGFVRGVGTSACLWRHVLPVLAAEGRGIAVDLPLHGRPPAAPDRELGLPALAAGRPEPALRGLHVPTLIVWGTDDVFFDRRWAPWLQGSIPGATEVVEIADGRLSFPDELVAALRTHWQPHIAGFGA